jgi:hypothetical protein
MPVLNPTTIISTLLKSKSAHEHTHHSKFVVIKSTRCDLTSSGVFLIVADCSELSPSYRATLPQELRLPPLPYSANWSGSLVDGATNLGMKFLFSLTEMLPTNAALSRPHTRQRLYKRLNLYFRMILYLFVPRVRSQRRQMTNFGDHGQSFSAL